MMWHLINRIIHEANETNILENLGLRQRFTEAVCSLFFFNEQTCSLQLSDSVYLYGHAGFGRLFTGHLGDNY